MATTKTTKSKETTVSKTKSTKKTTTTKKVTAKEAISKKQATTRRASNSTKKLNKKTASNVIEYYDLPDKYNQTMVKLLFQTPKKLFVYWEISDNDKEKFLEEKGKDFFENSTPYLIVKNKTKNYSFEIEINDFANSWYFDIPDSNSEYAVELIRKNNTNKIAIPIISSNEIEVPNNQILFDQNRKEIFFKNVKTNAVVSKTVANLQFLNYAGNVRKADSFYKKFYNEDDLIKITNPTSN